jgi:hypothetical protein
VTDANGFAFRVGRYGYIESRGEAGWWDIRNEAWHVDAARIALWADLIANPTESE